MMMLQKNRAALRRISVILFFVAASFESCKKPSTSTPPPVVDPATTFTNPLLSSGPDPWIIQKDNQYYYTHTLGNRIALWKTEKVSELNKATPQTIWTAPATGVNSKDVWAPEVHFLDG